MGLVLLVLVLVVVAGTSLGFTLHHVNTIEALNAKLDKQHEDIGLTVLSHAREIDKLNEQHRSALAGARVAGEKAGLERAINEGHVFLGEVHTVSYTSASEMSESTFPTIVERCRQKLQEDGWCPISTPRVRVEAAADFGALPGAQRLKVSWLAVQVQAFPPEDKIGQAMPLWGTAPYLHTF